MIIYGDIMASKKQKSDQQTVNTETEKVQIPADQKDAQIMDLTDTLKRLQAEFENYKKRTEKENSILIQHASTQLVKELLPVLDSFELALKNNHIDNPEIAKYRKGLELIYTQLFSTLEDEGLRIIDTQNKKFDPYKHEVLMIKESDKDDDVILEELQKGYMLNAIVLRHSKVVISKKREVPDEQH